MKTVRRHALILVLSFGAVSGVAADNNAPDLTTDPDATPAAFQDKPAPNPEAVAEVKEEKERAAENRNWLWRGYQDELQARDPAQSQDENNNFYALLPNDKELARAAGVSPTQQPVTEAPQMDVRTGSSEDKPALSLRPDAALNGAGTKTSTSPVASFQPFITSFDAPAAMKLTDFTASFMPSSPAPAAAMQTTITTDPDALDIPGMTAAESDPQKEADLTLDLLPGETPSEAKRHQDLALELPPPTDAEQVQKQQAAALSPPGVPGEKPKVAAVKPVLEPLSPTANMVPDPSPIRGASLANPFDILR